MATQLNTDTIPQASLTRQDSSTAGTDARFSCNICLDSVQEPVVTQCGHLYCWPCLYRWLEPGMYPEERASLGLGLNPMGSGVIFDNGRRVCPVCKSACSVPTLVPIYVRSSSAQEPQASVPIGQQNEPTQQEQQRPERNEGSVVETIDTDEARAASSTSPEVWVTSS